MCLNIYAYLIFKYLHRFNLLRASPVVTPFFLTQTQNSSKRPSKPAPLHKPIWNPLRSLTQTYLEPTQLLNSNQYQIEFYSNQIMGTPIFTQILQGYSLPLKFVLIFRYFLLLNLTIIPLMKLLLKFALRFRFAHWNSNTK